MALGLVSGFRPSAGMIDGFFTCTTCHRCASECPSGANPPAVILAARKILAGSSGMTPHQKIIRERIDSTANSLGDNSSRISWLNEPAVPQTSDYVYFSGCMASYRYPATAAATYRILKKFGVGLLKDERCCGSPLINLGLDASALIEHNSDRIREAGAHAVVVGCAGCYSMFREHYPGIKVVHLSEFLADRLEQLQIGRLDVSVTYHDPCHLGRAHGIYDPPRMIIEHICTFVEMNDCKTGSLCCGGGGGVRLGYPELSGSIASLLVRNIPHDVNYVVTACPLCYRNLSEAGIKVLDLADLISMSLE